MDDFGVPPWLRKPPIVHLNRKPPIIHLTETYYPLLSHDPCPWFPFKTSTIIFADQLASFLMSQVRSATGLTKFTSLRARRPMGETWESGAEKRVDFANTGWFYHQRCGFKQREAPVYIYIFSQLYSWLAWHRPQIHMCHILPWFKLHAKQYGYVHRSSHIWRPYDDHGTRGIRQGRYVHHGDHLGENHGSNNRNGQRNCQTA